MVDLWENFLLQPSNGTFLHTRKYLSYHGDRFKDSSFLVYDGNTLIGLIPLAATKEEAGTAISHPGISYGGIIHTGSLLGQPMRDTFELLIPELASREFSSLKYRAIPHIYSSFPAQDDIYALHQLGAHVSRTDLSSTIATSFHRPFVSKYVKRLANFPIDFELRVGFEEVNEFWEILSSNLAAKYDSLPTHSLDEMMLLHSFFKDEIQLYSVIQNETMLAGVLIYRTKQVWHMQYIASSDEGRKVQALDWLIQRIIQEAKLNLIPFLDFGHSNERNGTYLNSSLYKFKSKFGGGGIVLLELNLDISQ